MIKALLFLTLITGYFLPLGAQDVAYNTTESATTIYILVPFSQYFYAADSPLTQYQMSVNLNSSRKKNEYQNILNIELSKDLHLENAAQVFVIHKSLDPGNYTLITLLRNRKFGDKKEKQFRLTIPPDNIHAVRELILAENDNLMFYPSAYDQISDKLKSCRLILDPAAEADSIVVEIKYATGSAKITLPPGAERSLNLIPYLQADGISDISVRYYDKNTLLVRSDFLYNSYDKFNRLFSPKNQIEQIRYIANQNEWNTIKKLADKDMNAAIEYFWERHNNNPGSFRNDLRQLFYERVLKADEMFTIHKKMPGWRSDRGKIYIRMGAPDDIVSDVYPIGRYPYIEWHYFRENRIYRFIDRTGFGNYQLIGDYYEK